MNTPGPFYTYESDWALLGPSAAPDFVAIDAEERDIVFRQPFTHADITTVRRAADCDPFDGYAADGNQHWTVAEVRAWWARRDELREYIRSTFMPSRWRHASERPRLERIGAAWLLHFDTEVHGYLRAYCAFLDTRVWPTARQRLPEL